MPAPIAPIPGSSNIAGVGYDHDTQELTVQFHSGRRYTYDSVPESVYDALMAADSKGRYFNDNIKNQYVAR